MKAFKPNPLPKGAKRNIYRAKCAWAWMILFVEWKRDEDGAAFHFDTPGFLHDTEKGELSRAQISKYSSEAQLRQHRRGCISVYFCKHFVRLLFWDRAGCVVSTPIDLSKSPYPFFHFLYRFIHLPASLQGYDTSAQLATPSEIKLLTSYKSDNQDLMAYCNHMLVSQLGHPIYKASLRLLYMTLRYLYDQCVFRSA